MAGISVKVEGLVALDKKLTALADEYGPKAAASPVRSALRVAAKVLVESAKRHVHPHYKTGTLEQNIIATAERRPKAGQVEMRVTVRAKAKAFKSNSRNVRKGLIGLEYQHYGPLFYARFLEFGASQMPAGYPFLTPAWTENKDKLPEIIRDQLAKAIDKTMARLAGIK